MNIINKKRPLFEKYNPYSKEISKLLTQIALNECKPPLNKRDLEILLKIGNTYLLNFPPLCAFFGGIVSQEAIKSITGKFNPINQIFIYDTLELLPNNVNDIILENNRSDSLKYLLSQSTYEKLKNLNTLLVGGSRYNRSIKFNKTIFI